MNFSESESNHIIKQVASGGLERRLTAWIISVRSGSGSGLMFKSSSSKRTAILVISISSSGRRESKQTSKQRLEGLDMSVGD